MQQKQQQQKKNNNNKQKQKKHTMDTFLFIWKNDGMGLICI